jgi:hypothetical protein
MTGSLWARLEPGWGVPLMLVLGAPWPLALVLAEGGWPYSGLTLRELLGALGGSQAMKFKAPPLGFILAFVVGSLPFVLLLWPAVRRLWHERANAVERFLLAWIGGYLAYLELISSKPALYTVPALMPAAAAAVALLLTTTVIGSGLQRTGPLAGAYSPRNGGSAPGFHFPSFPAWPGWLAVLGWPVLVVALHRLTETPLSAPTITATAVIALALAVASLAAWARLAALWAGATIAAFTLFLGFTFGFLLPGLGKGWATQMIVEAIEPLARCSPGRVVVAGYREPSAVFTFGADNVRLPLPSLAADVRKLGTGATGTIVVERSTAGPALTTPPTACIEAVNFTKGCSQSFDVYAGERCPKAGVPTCASHSRPVRNLTPCR